MAKRGGMYNQQKRQKELKRKKKQDEKILKRQKAALNPAQSSDGTESQNAEQGVAIDAPETADSLNSDDEPSGDTPESPVNTG